jgi:hypothetical protein
MEAMDKTVRVNIGQPHLEQDPLSLTSLKE